MLDGIMKGMGLDPKKLESDFQSFIAVAKDVQARLVRIEEKLDTSLTGATGNPCKDETQNAK